MTSTDPKLLSPVTAPNGRDEKPSRLLGELRRRLLGWMLLVSLVPLIVMAGQGYHCAMEAIMEKTADHLLSILSSRRALVEAWIKERFREMDTLAACPEILGVCTAALHPDTSPPDEAAVRILLEMQKGGHSYDHLSVFDLNWTEVAKASHSRHTPDQLLAGGLQKELENASGYVLGKAHLHEDGSVGLHVARPLFDAAGRRRGALVANLNLSQGLTPLLRDRTGMGETGKVYIVSQDMDILTEPFGAGEPVAMRTKITPPHDAARHVLAEVYLGEHTDYRGRRVIGCAERIPEMNWFLVVEQDQSEALAWLPRLLFRALVTGVVTLVLLVVVAVWISERLGRPLRDLARTALRIRNGHVNERLGPMPGSEAEEVRKAFNAMLDNLREKQRQLLLSATLASVGELSSSVVHEMRNPLSSIKMNLNALRAKVADDPAHRELADIASNQVQRVENMLDDLLRYGRPLELRPQLTTFQELAEAALAVIGDKAESAGVRIELEDKLGGVPLPVDREQMCRALTNLLDNAVQASPAGQAVRLCGRRNSAAEDQAQLEVCDTGPGLSPEAEARAFRPFFTTKPNGTGLGLANVRKIVELHGGSVSARNRPEGGASFVLTLPLKGAV